MLKVAHASALVALVLLAANCAPKKSGNAQTAAEPTAVAAPAETNVPLVDDIGNRADHMLGVFKGKTLKEGKECFVEVSKYTYPQKGNKDVIVRILTALNAEIIVPSDGRRSSNVFYDTSDEVLNSHKIVIGSGGVEALTQNPFTLILRQYDKTELHFFGKKLTSAHAKEGRVEMLLVNTTETEIHCMNLAKQ